MVWLGVHLLSFEWLSLRWMGVCKSYIAWTGLSFSLYIVNDTRYLHKPKSVKMIGRETPISSLTVSARIKYNHKRKAIFRSGCKRICILRSQTRFDEVYRDTRCLLPCKEVLDCM